MRHLVDAAVASVAGWAGMFLGWVTSPMLTLDGQAPFPVSVPIVVGAAWTALVAVGAFCHWLATREDGAS